MDDFFSAEAVLSPSSLDLNMMISTELNAHHSQESMLICVNNRARRTIMHRMMWTIAVTDGSSIAARALSAKLVS